MKKYHFFLILTLLLSTVSLAQVTWTFNNNSLNGWTTHRLVDDTTPNTHITLTTENKNNPRFDHATANVNADVLKFAIIKMRIAAGGPNYLQIKYGSKFTGTSLSPGTGNFETYVVNMTDDKWKGTQNDIQLAFKQNDGTPSGATHNSNNIAIDIQEISFVDNIYGSATELYVDLASGNDNSFGTSASPLKTITYALNTAAANNIANVYVKSGTYNLTSTIEITAVATTPIVLSPEPNGTVIIRTIAQRGISIDGAKNIEIKGFEFDGKSNNTDHWVFVSEYVWLPKNTTDAITGSGICIRIENGEDLKITNNVFHDFYQKSINIEDARYLKIEGNVIHNIGLTSLSGGHGIMRQQGFGSFSDADDTNKYRWEIEGNLIFNVHQRIYSWVPAKGFLNMTLDEGKPILIDETPDHDQGMKARIKNNVVAYSKIDAIRLKPTNNLEVSNNTVYTRGHHADGITDTANGFKEATFGTPFKNFKANNNAVDVYDQRETYELGDADGSTGSSFSGNIAAFGSFTPTDVATLKSATLFKDPENGDFSLSDPSLIGVGIDPAVLSSLEARAKKFNVTVANDNWEHEHEKMMQTLLDNIPGLEDGVSNNEIIFTDSGSYFKSDLEDGKGRKSLYFTVNATWWAATDRNDDNFDLDREGDFAPFDGKYEIVVPEDYAEWYDHVIATYLRDTNGNGTGDTAYDRLRYGESVIKQNKIFPNNNLYVVEIETNTKYHKTEAEGFDITLDGDILFDFKYTPEGYEVFDIMLAANITTANTGVDLFDNVKMIGYSGDYDLSVVSATATEPAKLRLKLTDILTSTWTGSANTNDWTTAGNWDTNAVPSTTSHIVIPSGLSKYPTTSAPITVNSIEINSGASFIFGGVVTGEITYERNLPTTDWYFVAPPVSGETISDIRTNHDLAQNNTKTIFGFAPFTNSGSTPWNYITSSTTGNIEKGKGYSIKLKEPNAIRFTGTANTVNFDFGITTGDRNNFNLLGNPFTAYLNSETFTNSNSAYLTEKTVWIWDEDQYKEYNTLVPIEIAPAQAFFVEASGNNDVTFNIGNQSHQSSDTFMKQTSEHANFELFVTNNKTTESTKVFYLKDKTTGFDNGYDSSIFGGANYDFKLFTELVSNNDGRKLGIQALPNSNYESMIIPVGIIAEADEEITFSANINNFPKNINVFLEDRTNNIFTDLSESNYKTILSSASKGIGQFYIRTGSKTLSINKITSIKNIDLYKSDISTIKIVGLPEGITNFNLYNILGKEVFSTSFKSNGVHEISLPNFAKGLYIVKLKTEIGLVSKKVILE